VLTDLVLLKNAELLRVCCVVERFERHDSGGALVIWFGFLIPGIMVTVSQVSLSCLWRNGVV
jgi:hypothetical protein